MYPIVQSFFSLMFLARFTLLAAKSVTLAGYWLYNVGYT
jgi:hypothetical protein